MKQMRRESTPLLARLREELDTPALEREEVDPRPALALVLMELLTESVAIETDLVILY